MIIIDTSRTEEFSDLVCELTSIREENMCFRVHRPSLGNRSSYMFNIAFEDIKPLRFPSVLIHEQLSRADAALR